MKTKKILSILSAVAISGSVFAGLAVTASAADVDLTFAGDGANHAVTGVSPISLNGGGRWNNANANVSAAILDSVSDELKALYDTDGDNNIDAEHVTKYANWIGKDVTVSIDVTLDAGAYTVYYGGKSNNFSTVTLDNGTALDVGNRIDITSDYGVYPMTLILSDAYTGSITFASSSSYLPDLYSIKIVDTTFSDTIVAADVVRTADAGGKVRKNMSVFSSYTVNDNCPAEAKASFGNDLSKAGYAYLSYTSGLTDYAYMTVAKSGTYAVDLLSENTTDTKVEFLNPTTNAVIAKTVASNKESGIASTDTGSSVNYYTSSDNVVLDAGIYKVHIVKNSNKNYYSNFIALAMREVAVEEPELKGTVAKVAESVDKSGNAAAAYTATFTSENSFVANKIVWTVNNVKSTVTPATQPTQLDGMTITLDDGEVVFGLLIDAGAEGQAALDAIGTVTAVIK